MRRLDLQRLRPVLALVLLFGTGLLAVRVWGVAGEISTHGGQEASRGGAHNGRLEKLAASMAERQERRRAARDLSRDPFRAPFAIRSAPGAAAAAPAAPVEAARPVPVVRALVYDDVKPAVQLAVGAETSRWLGRGEAFLGWIVLEISPASVRVGNGVKQHVLDLN